MAAGPRQQLAAIDDLAAQLVPNCVLPCLPRSVPTTKPLEEQAVPQAAIAHDGRLPTKLRDHGPDDARAGENHIGPFGLQAHGATPFLDRAGAIEVDLPIDLGEVEDGALHDFRLIGCELVLDGRKVGGGAPQRDQRGRRRPSVQRRELGGDRVECRGQNVPRRHGH